LSKSSVVSVAGWAGSVSVLARAIGLLGVSKWASRNNLLARVGGSIVSVAIITGGIVNTDTLGVLDLANWAVANNKLAHSSGWVLGVASWALGWDLLALAVHKSVSGWAFSLSLLAHTSNWVVLLWSNALVVWNTVTCAVLVLALWATISDLLTHLGLVIVGPAISTLVGVLLGADIVNEGVANWALSGGVDTLLLSVAPDVWGSAVVG